MVYLKLKIVIFILHFHANVFAMDIPLSLETYKKVQAKIEWAAMNSSEIHKGGLISEGVFNLVTSSIIYIKCAKSQFLNSCSLHLNNQPEF